MLRRFALLGLACSTALAWSMACSSGDGTKTGDRNAAGAAGEGNGSGTGGANFAGAGNGGYGNNISIGTGSSSGTGSTSGSAGSGSGSGVSCAAPDGSGPSQCSNGVDDDGDGQIDGLDVECTGACDDDESSFATGIPGDNKDKKQDCFFDGDSGAGNDGCKDPKNPSAECIAFCKPLTSNGCDCFGCCTVHLEDGSTTSVQLGGECNDFETDVGTSKCQTCTPSTACMNTCGDCELCPGKTELPASCNSGSGGGGSTIVCDNGAKACAAGGDCGATGYCQLGCCVEIIFK